MGFPICVSFFQLKHDREPVRQTTAFPRPKVKTFAQVLSYRVFNPWELHCRLWSTTMGPYILRGLGTTKHDSRKEDGTHT